MIDMRNLPEALIDRMQQITDEKYVFLGAKERQAKYEGEKFDHQLEVEVFYNMRIAHLELLIEQIQNQ